MPVASVHASILRLQHGLRAFCGLAVVNVLAGSLIGVGLLSSLVQSGIAVSAAWLLSGLVLGYIAAVVLRLRRTYHTLQQLRLERLLVNHAEHLVGHRQCLTRRDHLWSRSRILAVLQSLQAKPLSDVLLWDERIRLLNERYRVAFRAHRPRLLNPSMVLLLGLGAWIGMSTFEWMLLGLLPLLLLEAVLLAFTWRLSHRFHALYAALSTWTLHSPFIETIHTSPSTSYTHRLMYRARPWFTPAPVLDAS